MGHPVFLIAVTALLPPDWRRWIPGRLTLLWSSMILESSRELGSYTVEIKRSFPNCRSGDSMLTLIISFTSSNHLITLWSSQPPGYRSPDHHSWPELMVEERTQSESLVWKSFVGSIWTTFLWVFAAHLFPSEIYLCLLTLDIQSQLFLERFSGSVLLEKLFLILPSVLRKACSVWFFYNYHGRKH